MKNMRAGMIRKMSEVIQKQINQSLQKKSFKGVLINMQQIYSRTPKCDFHVYAKGYF